MTENKISIQKQYFNKLQSMLLSHLETFFQTFGAESDVKAKGSTVADIHPRGIDKHPDENILYELTIESPRVTYQIRVLTADKTFYHITNEDERCSFIVEMIKDTKGPGIESKTERTYSQHVICFREVDYFFETIDNYFDQSFVNVKNDYIGRYFFRQNETWFPTDSQIGKMHVSQRLFDWVSPRSAAFHDSHSISFNIKLTIKEKIYRQRVAFIITLEKGNVNIVGLEHEHKDYPISQSESFFDHIERHFIPSGDISVGKYLLRTPPRVCSLKYPIPEDKMTYQLYLEGSNNPFDGILVNIYPIMVGDNGANLIKVEVVKGYLSYTGHLPLMSENMALAEQLEQLLPEWLDNILTRYFIEK